MLSNIFRQPIKWVTSHEGSEENQGNTSSLPIIFVLGRPAWPLNKQTSNKRQQSRPLLRQEIGWKMLSILLAILLVYFYFSFKMNKFCSPLSRKNIEIWKQILKSDKESKRLKKSDEYCSNFLEKTKMIA